MSLIQLPQRFLAQPQYDASIHPEWLARGLVVACNPAVGAFNQVTQQFVTNSGGIGITPTTSGLSWQGAASKYIDFGAGYGAGSVGATIIQVINQGSLVNQFTFSSRAGVDMAGIEVLIGAGAVPGRAQVRMNPVATIITPDLTGLDDGKDHVLAVRYTPSVELAIWADGINNKQSTASAPASQSTSQNLRLHSRGTTYYTGKSGLFLYFNRPLDDADVQALLENPSIIYRAPPRLLWLTSPPGEATGSVAYTNADDISEAVAAPVVTASSATTNADDISDASVGSEVSGTVAVTNADDISAATASPVVSASSGTTNADDVSSAAGNPVVSASAANTNADDISDASAAVGSEVVGSVAYTNIDDASSAILKATITASVAVTNSDDISSAFSGAVVDGSVAVTNADDVSAADASPVVSGSSATTNADDVSNAEAIAEAGEIIASVNVVNADDISSAVAAPVITASISYSNLHDLSAAIAEINFGTIVEALLTTGIIQDTRIKKPGIPSDAPEWQRTMFEIFTGRRGNKITVAPHQTLSFSAIPTKEECEALYNYVSEVRQSIDQLTKRFDS